MEEFKKVEINSYVKKLIEQGTVPREAVKYTRVIAMQGKIGETVISWSVDSNGREIQEKVAQVKIDEKTNQPGWIVTKVDEQGNIIIDNNNHPNQWIIEDSKFKDKYEIDPVSPSLYKPKGGPQVFIQITENITLNQWGSDMQIAAGGYINITNPNDMYGISKRDFNDTYKFVENQSKYPKL